MNGKVNKQIIEEAASWFVDFRVGDVDAHARKAFHEWLRRSPEHIQAYLDIATTYAELPAPSADGKLDVQALIDQSRSRPEATIVPLEVASSRRSSSARADCVSLGERLVAIAAAAVMAIALGWFYMERGTYSTDVGEQRSLILSDGSTVVLNSRSRVRVRYSDEKRQVVLLSGQALFQVASDKERPFVVDVGDTHVRAVGTQFDVYRKHSGTVVTVVEGTVAVDFAGSTESAPSALMLVAGEQLATADIALGTAAPDAIPRVPVPKIVDVSAVTAWTQRQLIFDNASLAEVAEEFNRYSTRPIVIEPGAADTFHVSGIYSSVNHESLLRFLRAQPGIRLIESDREIRIVHE